MASPSSAVVMLVMLVIVASSAQQFYANTRYGKRGDLHGSQFWSGLFGRSGAGGRQVERVPRQDFFIGSRYGKRSADADNEDDWRRVLCRYHLYDCPPRDVSASHGK